MGKTQEKNKYCDGMNLFQRIIKRLFDVFCSLVGMLLLSPLFLYIYIRLRMQGDGPVMFEQERVGYKGKPFNILKYRTMRVGSDENEEPNLATKDDARLTPFGRFLRERHLDELPQLWNVFVGDMSFVGPRPERKFFIDKIMQHNTDYDYVYLMRPGLTSPASVYNGYTDTMEKMLIRLDMDLEYLQKRSLWLDIKIIFITVYYILKGKKI
ncbi:MAG: sugar transferase [Bacteroidaceae bacterium]|nr:sugar transferase [Bacteroidaceae bacterium]